MQPTNQASRPHATSAAVALCVSLSLATSSGAQSDPVSVSYELPSLDRWNYPFNQTPGTRSNASIFGAYVGEDLSPDFDNRDAQFHIAFTTAEDIEPGLGADSYLVTEATVTVQISNNNQFRYDPTYDPWQTYLPSDDPEFIPDETLGRPIELYGVGFRNEFDPLSYQEGTPFTPSGFGIGKSIRTTYALDFDDEGEPRDVSNNIDEAFDPYPFAIGTTDTVTPGSFVPATTIFTFELDLDDPFVQQYLGEQLDLGKLHFMFASLHEASEDDFSGSFPEFYTKENQLVIGGVREAARLSITVEFIDDPGIVGDLNGDGVVDGSDLLALLAQWGPCDDPGDCSADLDDSGVVDGADLLMMLSNWG